MDYASHPPASEQYSFVMERGLSETAPLTLLRRSRRVLGDINLGEVAAPPSGAPGHSEQAADKRRQQVRKAQRTHRQRTQTYIKELEKEVLRLRTCENNCLARVDHLEHRVNTLLTTLASYNIPAPPETPRPATSSSTGHVVVGAVDDPSAAHVSLSFLEVPGPLSMEAEHNISNPTRSDIDPGSSMLPTAAFLPNNVHPTLLEDPRVGINFILALERLCLDHLRTSHLDYDDRAFIPDERACYGSHHIFTASLQLWQPDLRRRSAHESYDISIAEIERLLKTSLNIGVSDDEITPVQIWHHLKNFILPEEDQRNFLEKLTEELCKLVECIHFGAVIPLRNFNEVLREHLPEAVIV